MEESLHYSNLENTKLISKPVSQLISKQDNQSIRLTLLANEGILIQFGQTKILIDGLHENSGGVFSGLSPMLREDLLAGEKPLFQDIDYLLVTHCHGDHFSASLTEAFLNRHRVKGFFLPDRESREHLSLRETARRQSDLFRLLDLPLEQKQKILLEDDISLTIYRSVHAGKQYTTVENYCYLLELGGRTLFIIADGDYDAAYFTRLLADEKIDIALVNPLFLSLFSGRKVIRDALKPGQLVIYHIPFAGSDPHGFRNLVTNEIRRHKDDLPPVTVLWDELQEIIFIS